MKHDDPRRWSAARVGGGGEGRGGVAGLGEGAALVEAGPILGTELQSGATERAGGGDCNGDSNDHAPSIGLVSHCCRLT